MPKTDLLGVIYPSEGQDPFYEIFKAGQGQWDGYVYSAIENPNLFLRGGGSITLNAGSNEMTWTEDLQLINLLTGGVVTISADTLAGLEDGKLVYVAVSRPISGASTGELAIADTLPISDLNKVFVAMRVGSALYMRNQVNVSTDMFNIWDAAGVITGNAKQGGGLPATGSFSVNVERGAVFKMRVTAIGDTVDSDIKIFYDAGQTEQYYEALNKDCYTNPFVDNSPWGIGPLVDGTLYYEITNNGANDSTYKIEVFGIGKVI